MRCTAPTPGPHSNKLDVIITPLILEALLIVSSYMNPQPAPEVPGKTDAERFSNAVKMVLAVPPKAVTKEKKRIKRTTAIRKQARAVR